MSDPEHNHDEQLKEAFLNFARAFAGRVRDDADLRSFIKAAAKWLLDETAESPTVQVVTPKDFSDFSAPPAVTPKTIDRTLHIAGEKVELSVVRDSTYPIAGPNVVAFPEKPVEHELGSGAHLPAWRSSGAGIELTTICSRSRLKAESCRWKIEQRRIEQSHGDQSELPVSYDSLIVRAKQHNNCFLWMLQWQAPPRDSDLSLIAECYENLARAADIGITWSEREEQHAAPPIELLRLAAEAQSALREALLRVAYSDDPDQTELFFWLRNQADAHGVYIDRHLRKDDPANPDAWPGLRERIANYLVDCRTEKDTGHKRTQLLNKIQYHLNQLDDERFDDSLRHWQAITSALDHWIDGVGYASDRELCDLLMPVAQDLPADLELSGGAEQVFRYVDVALSAADADSPNEELARATLPDEVKPVLDLLRDRVVLLIGGDVRDNSRKRLERDLELRELRWLSCKPHQSLSTFEPAIAEQDVAAVLLMIRLASHMHGDLSGICEQYGKPFVRLQGGYGSNQVAFQILQQVSDKLLKNVEQSEHAETT